MNVSSGNQQEKKLRQLFRSLGQADQETLIRFAEFLAASPATVTPDSTLQVPENLPRPAEESVVKAIKRLRQTYPMLNADKLLQPTSDLMSAHVIKGQAASDVIDALEALFSQHYQQYKDACANF
ncbi:hypothetical protein [Thiolinea disciformis]|uniref:hypothetical protein n=1 Tax=Thiolinea disciformis TaxID=125614 RepID=UPI000382E37C|nr:hypothetical protein [Thiolinea disciformis]